MSKESFEVEQQFEVFYTGGKITWSKDGEHIFCQNEAKISVLSLKKGLVQIELGVSKSEAEPGDIINTFTYDESNDTIITHHTNSLFKLWNWRVGKLLRLWKSTHNGPVANLDSKNGKLLASGGTDGSVRLWNLEYKTCTHNLKGLQGVVSVLSYHPDANKDIIFASGMGNIIHGWDINDGSIKCKLNGHYSEVTALAFHENGVHLVSCARDKVLILWDFIKSTSLRTILTYDGIQDIFIIPSTSALIFERENADILVAGAGEKGVLKIFNANSGKQVYEQKNSLILPAKEEDCLSVTHLLYNRQLNDFAMVSTDHNIIIHSLETFACKKQLVGYNDEILDLTFLGNSDSYLAVATNSNDIKLFELASMNCQLLCGHKDIVLALATTSANRNLMISSDKQGSIRMWLLKPETAIMTCVGIGTRHIDAVGSIAMACKLTFFVSVSQSGILNTWNMPEKLEKSENEIMTLNVSQSVKVHDKDINNVTVSPNDKLIATGSQDKTAKLWSADSLQLLGVFKGHKRGVWCVRFSPVDQILLTTSADCTIKLWSLENKNCLKTLQSHESSVLRAEFLNRGTQLITSGGDGLLKLWNIKSSECINTLDKHDDKVWALAVNKMETHIVSGGRNSLLVIWRDVTEEKKQQAIKEQEELLLQEQKLANLIQAEKLTDALSLALKLDKPFQVLKIIEDVIKRDSKTLARTIKDLKPAQQEELLKCATIWNTNGRNAEAAQNVIHVILKSLDTDELKELGFTDHLEALLPYTQRHFNRLTDYLQKAHFLKYMINQWKLQNSECDSKESDESNESHESD